MGGGSLSYNHIFLLVDKEVYPYPNGKKKATVYYTRDFPSSLLNKHQAWCMPFDYTISEEDKLNFLFYEIKYIANSEIHYDQIYDKMLANTPYLIKPLNIGTYTFKAKNVVLEKQVDNRIILSLDDGSYINTFYQTYKSTNKSDIDTPYKAYAMSGGTYVEIKSNGPSSYRWYFIKVPKS